MYCPKCNYILDPYRVAEQMAEDKLPTKPPKPTLKENISKKWMWFKKEGLIMVFDGFIRVCIALAGLVVISLLTYCCYKWVMSDGRRQFCYIEQRNSPNNSYQQDGFYLRSWVDTQ